MNKIKNILVISVLTLIVLVSGVNAATPAFKILDGEIPTISAGEEKKIEFIVKNTVNVKAVAFTISPDIDEDTPFTFNSLSPSKTYTYVGGYSKKEVDFTIKAIDTVKEGIYPINFKMIYSDKEGSNFEAQDKIYIKVINAKSNVDLGISVKEGYVLNSGENEKINIEISNNSEVDIKDVKITYTNLSNGALSLYEGSNSYYISKLTPNEMKTIENNFFAANNLLYGNYELDINVEYFNESNVKFVENKRIFIIVDGDKEDKNIENTVPKVIISKYEIVPRIVNAGEEFDLNMEFENTSSQKDIRNIKVFFTVDEESNETGNVFTPVNSSNTFYISKIEKQSTASKKMRFFTIPDAKQKTYTINVNFEYEDNNAKEYTAKELIGIPVVQESKLEFSEMNFNEEIYAKDPLNIYLDFYNTGKVSLFNTKVKIEGDFKVDKSSYFVGNFESGNSDYFEASVYPNKVGINKGKITFTFDDVAGIKRELIKEFEFTAKEEIIEDDFEMNNVIQESNVNKKSPLKFLWLVLVVPIVIVIIKKKKKKKKKVKYLNE